MRKHYCHHVSMPFACREAALASAGELAACLMQPANRPTARYQPMHPA